MLTPWIVWLVVTVVVGILFALCEYHSFDVVCTILMMLLCLFETMMMDYLIPYSAKHQFLMEIGLMVLSIVVFFVVYLPFEYWLENRNLRK